MQDMYNPLMNVPYDEKGKLSLYRKINCNVSNEFTADESFHFIVFTKVNWLKN